MQGNGMALYKQYIWYVMMLERHGIVWYFGQVHRRRSAQRMRCETSNTAIDLCPVPPFTMIHTTSTTSFTQILHQSFTSAGGHSLQLMHLEVNVPRLELEFGGGLFPMQILIAWDFHKSKAWYVAPLVLGRMPGFVMEE